MDNHRTRVRIVGILTLAGTPSYFLCLNWHICMAGHMQHGPYPLHEWLNDLWWAACLASVFVFSLTLHAKRRILFLIGSILLILLRVPLGSLGGASSLLELPLLVVMGTYAILFFIRPGRYQLSVRPDAPLK